ncbi:hypothetical protein [Alteromonas gracilis]|uniref:TonB C-terminal domain-containing protein n=1 Tax=Alteromonas gracilis TaxID=1479524 RepID=A0ABX5CRZ8_9ALTE|nr:hypothetical protein [Alteromonas gracilis]PRO70150.1 hypothetical protein C6Y39_04010 [Alteromonas gracilis]
MKKLVILPLISLTFYGCNSTQPAKDDVDFLASVIENRQTIKPIVYIAPKYPAQEFSNGVEGNCKVEFDVLGESGALSKPTNVKPLDCPNQNFFEHCKSAVQYWRFKRDQQEPTTGLHTTCRFEIERT